MNPQQIPALDTLSSLAMPVMHGLIALWGLVDCFFGLRIFKVTIRIFMSFAGAMGAAMIAAQFWPGSVPVMLGACVAGLILGFLLGWFVYKLGVVLLAVFAGYVLVSPFVATIAQPWGAILPFAVGLLVGLAAFFLLEPVVIASTALTGAFRLVFGVSFFIGGAGLWEYIRGTRAFGEIFTGESPWIFVITLAIAAVGFYVQTRFSSSGKKKKEAKKDE